MVEKLRNFGDEALKPHPEGFVVHMIEKDLADAREAEGPRATAAGTRLRASFALNCARQIGFQVLHVPEDIAVPANVMMAFDVGQRFHERVQGIVERTLGAMSEVVIDLRPLGADISCHADFVYSMPDAWAEREGFVGGAPVIGEIKTIAGFGYLIVTGQRKSDEGPGPKAEHVTQAALAALGIEAQYVHLIYVDKDRHSIAEFLLDIDQEYARYGNLSPRQLAEAEIERMAGVLSRLDSGMLPARHIPGFGRVEIPPAEGSRDQPWNCRYCRWQPTCVTLESTPVPLDLIQHLIPGGDDGNGGS